MSRKKLLAIAGVIAISLGTAACASEGSAPPAAECGSGERIVVNLPNPTHPVTLDPNYDTIVNFTQVSRNMFDGLFKLDDNMEVIPNLATDFEQPDELTYEVALRDDVTFQDGSPFTSADVVSTFTRIASDEELASKLKSYVANVAAVEAVDDTHVTFTLKAPDASFIRVLATLIYITPASIIEDQGNADFGKSPVGTGPFMLKEWNEGDSVVLEANCDYFGAKPIPSEVEFRFIAEPATAISSLQSGEIDIAAAISPDLAAGLAGNSDLAVQTVDGNRTFWLTPNTLSGPFADERVRQALNYGIDKESIAADLLSGNATPRGQLYASNIFGATEGIDPYPFDPEMAKDLLAEAGYADGEVQIDLVTDGEDLRPVWQAIAANLADSGFTVTTTFDPTFFADTFLAKTMGENQIYLNSNNNLLMDADFALGLHFDGARRGIYFNTPETDAAIAEARALADPEERQAAYDSLNEVLFELAPAGFLYNTKVIFGTSSHIDWTPRPDQAIYLAGVTKTP
jgi:peptide/nickel transport system substrate-binding protein